MLQYMVCLSQNPGTTETMISVIVGGKLAIEYPTGNNFGITTPIEQMIDQENSKDLYYGDMPQTRGCLSCFDEDGKNVVRVDMGFRSYDFKFVDGAISEIIPTIYSDCDWHIDGVVAEYYPTGLMKKLYGMCMGEYDCMYMVWYDTGYLKYQIAYHQGIQHGYEYTGYDNGVCASEGWYDMGKRSGVYREFLRTQELITEVAFEEGEPVFVGMSPFV